VLSLKAYFSKKVEQKGGEKKNEWRLASRSSRAQF
jgi:hypothetical protein